MDCQDINNKSSNSISETLQNSELRNLFNIIHVVNFKCAVGLPY